MFEVLGGGPEDPLADILAALALAAGFLSDDDPGEKLALGIQEMGLRNFAFEIGANHLLDDPDWKRTFILKLANPSVSFHVNMAGFIGDTTKEKVENEMPLGNTGWELRKLKEVGRLPGVTFYENARTPVPNPFY